MEAIEELVKYVSFALVRLCAVSSRHHLRAQQEPSVREKEASILFPNTYHHGCSKKYVPIGLLLTDIKLGVDLDRNSNTHALHTNQHFLPLPNGRCFEHVPRKNNSSFTRLTQVEN